jgi:acetyltransferase-like isoleucine patch superfamily enzyme
MLQRVITELYLISEGLFALIPATFGNWLRSRNYRIWMGSMGCKFSIGQYSRIQRPKAVFIGNQVGFNDRAWIAANENNGEIYIGDQTLIGPNCTIHSGNHIFTNASIPIRAQGHEFSPIHIGKDVWIAANVTILKGVSIGDGSVIAAGSVVTHDVPAFTIYAGVPARKIAERN